MWLSVFLATSATPEGSPAEPAPKKLKSDRDPKVCVVCLVFSIVACYVWVLF